MRLSTPKMLRILLAGVLFVGAFPQIRNLKLGIGTANAQIPPNINSCSDVGDPEFHSLRPYQASPCQTEMDSTAKFCGNELIFHDTIKEEYPGGGTCTDNGTKVTCKYEEIIDKRLTIDLSGANLPFMGNTENVPNSQTRNGSDPPLDDADKVNGYVSWYLNGIINRAEDGTSKTTDYNLVNLSGPLNKLLPGAILDAQRIETIGNVDSDNHNQIAVCGDSNLGIIGDITGLGSFTPGECYEGNDTRAKGRVFRLKSQGGDDGWSDDLGWWSRWIGMMVDKLAPFFPGVARDVIETYIGEPWNKRIPPLPWSDEDGKPFATEDLYTKAYYEWRGNTCVLIPVINKVVCFDNILVPNKYADLYSYVPLSSTEDLKGQVIIDEASSATGVVDDDVAVSDITFSNQTPSTLFFSHMQESTELASALQDTFVSSSEQGNKTGSPTNVAPPAACTSVDVRSNKGDDLFATQLTGNLHYEVKFSCEFDSIPTCSGSCFPNQNLCNAEGGTAGTGTCPVGRYCCSIPGPRPPVQTCTKDIYIALSTTSSTPKVEDIWSQLVAGPQSIFKKIFPKTNTTGGMGQIKDIPGSTNITYTGLGISQQNTDLKLPHIGGISEYFLKGIQTALRPKGFGEPISFGESEASCSGDGSLPTLPPASGDCKLGTLGMVGSANLSSLPTLVSIVEAASQNYDVPPGLILGVMFGEGAFNGGSSAKYEWTEENVKKWSTGCESMPNCSPDTFPSTGVVPFFEAYWNKIKDAVKVVDPDRVPSPCNLMDAVFALAKDLNQSQNGSGAFSGRTCYGIPLNAGFGGSSNCSWDGSDYETAIRVWEFGTAYNSTYTCATLTGSCATGGGASAACPGGDVCEKVSSGGSSHNSCVWGVAHSH
ncbi:MAG: hypothetical protein UV71_C0001G0100 [Microgenomates group bacterium GW2011_GWC1_43_13]|uniref:Uncharacterized protein n=3 Tax=Candidatus Woeseibacteriota TaxID=1752722 RepID=A0A837IFM0_9BACT|nr:MAG: hypothetical protein UV71_C0001G0100 [Microgenomates group bacterium GW2011_GWC1_43_13]KKT54641.1 MAG: hypothetical protein UW47_C0004G0048 [Candidatus Woesebacteria bacterium GW2011_GWA1_44_23]OGM76432.1 MAG: hypothetical protein A2208_00065 [Candidatus Woesebacteria bacterium RIFOXYA1_FULL_43_16]OGM81624.1 MAG: hypothetical protein A2394_02290 [Candidatus Woesebacteria bacterium RIFOXYB1_FULL_42_36]OGM83712.1 MAG: hypothetical protein A2421_02520 [Candidatus Woesebacteria bacterium RI